MEKALLDIAEQLKTIEYLDDKALTKVINRNNKRILEEKRARAATEESRARTAATAEAPANREIGTTTAPEELRSEASLAGQPELAPADREPTPQTLDKTGAKINLRAPYRNAILLPTTLMLNATILNIGRVGISPKSSNVELNAPFR